VTIGNEMWKIRLVFEPQSGLTVYVWANRTAEEKLNSSMTRLKAYDITLSVRAGSFSLPVAKSYSRIWTALEEFSAASAWKVPESIQTANLRGESRGTGARRLVKHTVDVWWSIETSLVKEPVILTAPLSFANIITDLFDDPDVSNVVFTISNPHRNSEVKKYIYAHTKILATHSDYFRTMFESGFSEASATEISSDGESAGSQQLEFFADSDFEDNEHEEIPPTIVREVSNLNSKWRNVNIVDTSYTTYYSMLYYLYTKSYSFKPFSSSYKAANDTSRKAYNVANSKVVAPMGHKNVPRSSAKSMYRLCHRLEMPDLRQAALEHIKKSLTPENIAVELTSAFTSRFPEVQKIEKAYLVSHWNQVRTSAAFVNLFSGLFEEHPEGTGGLWLDVFKEIQTK